MSVCEIFFFFLKHNHRNFITVVMGKVSDQKWHTKTHIREQEQLKTGKKNIISIIIIKKNNEQRAGQKLKGTTIVSRTSVEYDTSPAFFWMSSTHTRNWYTFFTMLFTLWFCFNPTSSISELAFTNSANKEVILIVNQLIDFSLVQIWAVQRSTHLNIKMSRGELGVVLSTCCYRSTLMLLLNLSEFKSKKCCYGPQLWFEWRHFSFVVRGFYLRLLYLNEPLEVYCFTHSLIHIR